MGNNPSVDASIQLPKTSKSSDEYITSSGSIRCGVSSMQGWRKEMEDTHIIIDIPTHPDHLFLAVFDGHGGSVASDYAEKYMLQILLSSSQWTSYTKTLSRYDLAQALIETFLTIDLHMQSDLADQVQKCGCTAVVCLVTPTYIICANAGDSRCILGTNKQCINLSEDHKPNLPGEAQRIEAAGGFIERRRAGGGGRVDGSLAVSRGLGDFRFKARMDLSQQEQKVTCNPDIIIRERSPDDEFVLLACDGLWDVLRSDQAAQCVRTLYAEGEASQKLVAEELLDEAFTKGSKDNITAVVVSLPGAAVNPSLTGGVLRRRSRRTGEQELSALFALSGTYGLNIHPDHPFTNLNSGEDSLYIQSNADEQLLIHVTFQTTVKISSISMKSFNNDINSYPKQVKVYANLLNPSFSNVEEIEATEIIQLDQSALVDGSDTLNDRIRLKPSKFQRIISITFFIDENFGSEFTTLNELNIFGFTLDGLDVANIHEVKKSKK